MLAAGVVLSFGGLAFRLTEDVNAWQYVIYRGLGASIVTAAVLLHRHRGRSRRLLDGVDVTHVFAGLLFGAFSLIFIVAIERASVAFVLFLQTMAPIAAAYFSWILLRERVSRAVLSATAVSAAGVLIMCSATLRDRIDPLGLIAVFIPVTFGLYATLIRRADRMDPQIPVLVGGTTLALVGLIGAALTDGFSVSLHDAAIGLIAGSLLLAVPVAFLNHATRVVPAPEVALLLMSEVVLSPVWVWLFVDEEPEATTVIGGGLIFGAVFGLLLWRRRQVVGAG